MVLFTSRKERERREERKEEIIAEDIIGTEFFFPLRRILLFPRRFSPHGFAHNWKRRCTKQKKSELRVAGEEQYRDGHWPSSPFFSPLLHLLKASFTRLLYFYYRIRGERGYMRWKTQSFHRRFIHFSNDLFLDFQLIQRCLIDKNIISHELYKILFLDYFQLIHRYPIDKSAQIV